MFFNQTDIEFPDPLKNYYQENDLEKRLKYSHIYSQPQIERVGISFRTSIRTDNKGENII